MFGNRMFNLSVLFSIIWHLFWISIIGIVVIPSVQPSNVYQEVDFLGPILEKTAFDLMVEEVKAPRETLYAKSTLSLDNLYLRPKGPDRKVLKEFVPDVTFDRFGFQLQDFIKKTKEIPFYFAQDVRMLYAQADNKRALLLFVEGPAEKREIIFKPTTPVVPRGLYGDALEYIVKLKFFVSNNGIVHDVEPIISSGYPEIDLVATRFIKKWRFSPLSLVEKDKTDWGIVSVKIVTK